MKTIDKHIDEVMDWFDFETVHNVMTHLNWTWSMNDQPPTIPELRQCVRGLMRDAYTKNLQSISTGGFTIIYDKEHNTFDVSFSVSEWSSYPEEENKKEALFT